MFCLFCFQSVKQGTIYILFFLTFSQVLLQDFNCALQENFLLQVPMTGSSLKWFLEISCLI